MNKTKIDWCDMTWNPVTGCLHGCEYCYAQRMVNRFGKTSRATGECHEINQGRVRSYHEAAHHTGSYPYGFDPTLYADRLGEPNKHKKPQTIFVCSMADLFGEWVSDEWIRKVFEACERAPQHRYLFLTKNGQRYEQLGLLPDKDNYWFGTTRTGANPELECGASDCKNTFLSIEPILAPICGETRNALAFWDWIIIGAETGNRKEKVVPKRGWIEEIMLTCSDEGIPLFMKESLRALMGDDFTQEYPWDH